MKTLDEKAHEVAKFMVKLWGDLDQTHHPGRLHDYFAYAFKRGYNWRIRWRTPERKDRR